MKSENWYVKNIKWFSGSIFFFNESNIFTFHYFKMVSFPWLFISISAYHSQLIHPSPRFLNITVRQILTFHILNFTQSSFTVPPLLSKPYFSLLKLSSHFSFISHLGSPPPKLPYLSKVSSNSSTNSLTLI